ncbi:hypothetical protein [Xanthomonas arboricola]|uniref:hypothetical protein n=1 Tax=Xanthomonas arboricola TaxID=56448 RepID=UPI0011AFDDF3|nr:hypothetical protein [Xanthomonas arboricola]
MVVRQLRADASTQTRCSAAKNKRMPFAQLFAKRASGIAAATARIGSTGFCGAVAQIRNVIEMIDDI